MNAKPKTLVILSPGFPKDEGDTTCLPLQQVLLKTIKQNHPELELLIIAFQYPFKKRNYSWHGIPVMAFGGRGRGNVLRAYNWAKIWAALTGINKKRNIQGILSFWLGECAFIGERFAQTHHLKHYCWILGQDAKPTNRYYQLARLHGESMLALSDFIASSIYINYGMMPKHIVPGGLDTTMFANGNSERDIDILAAGSLITLKQYHLFIEVVCRLRRQNPNIKAVLCGEGPDRTRLTSMIKRLKMDEHITLAGELPHADVLKQMQRSKIFLHTSSYEGLGMVCLEALYAGAKVISFVKPMDAEIANWHIADSTLTMANIAHDILKDTSTIYSPMLVYDINDIARRIADLYAVSPSTIALKRVVMALNESVAL
ncbi:glycosyltransferase family 4 protein [Mucilaginibacter mali]|uniref:Glycosyltransferase family 4 protein n=1 Tax=Mucilaginibacter mali TaxID=2740462 RepID=A0A7D4TMC1_9SPHI|nr:glycosyltransferase [Mucilaginibacter mali]QKJ29913.1 glycosyltransferase family 4 protein [Mucilaginibacter mali]